jgi:pimeloyl-ACP methyl ester carboxylesterase
VGTKTVESGDATLCTESFGRPGDPVLLLIMGQMASMLWWPDGLCERLAAAGRLVIRYDNRDSGRSSSYPPGQPGYTSGDLTADAVAVLDGYGVERAHVVGMSMGGMIAQQLAVAHPGRVERLTLISTTALGEPDDELPGPAAAYLEHAEAAEGLDWSDTVALAAFIASDVRALAGTRHPVDEAATREFVRRDLARTINPAALVNHTLLRGDTDPEGASASQIEAPLRVIHGTADPLFPPAHGEALAAAVGGAELVLLEGGGHELHEGHWDEIVAAIVR